MELLVKKEKEQNSILTLTCKSHTSITKLSHSYSKLNITKEMIDV